ncbi:MAG: MerR family DNA-binding transcriptional regulator [Chloroflexota bacterium]
MFTVRQLAKLAGVTPRALRYYDARPGRFHALRGGGVCGKQK